MARQIKREFRGRKLTAEEAARDEELRAKVMAEFPPSRGFSEGTELTKSQLAAIDKTANDVTAQIMAAIRLVLQKPFPSEEDLVAAETKIRQSIAHYGRLIHRLPDFTP